MSSEPRTTFANGVNCFAGTECSIKQLTREHVLEFFEQLGRPGTTQECAEHFAVSVVRPRKICRNLAALGHLRSIARTGRGGINHYTFIGRIRAVGLAQADKYLTYVRANPGATAEQIHAGVGAASSRSTTYQALNRMLDDGLITCKKGGVRFMYEAVA